VIKAEFSASLLQCHMILHSNMMIWCSRNINDHHQCWKHCAA